MLFELAIESKNIITINPKGRLAVCCLWTPTAYVRRLLEECGTDLSEDSPVAVIGGLFGGGLKIMLRNLLYNPQLEEVLIYGKDFSGAGEHLANFFAGRVTRTGRRQNYLFADGTRREMETMAISGQGSPYIMDEMVQPQNFRHPPAVTTLPFGRPEDLAEAIRLSALRPKDQTRRERVKIELPRPEVEVHPSQPHSHVVCGQTIVETWEKVLYRLSRFGRPVTFRDGKKRHELLNFKAVILNPGQVDEDQLAYFNLSPAELSDYQKALLSPDLTEGDGSYSYGHRMRAWFGRDLLAAAAADLAQNLDSRHSFLTLWDNTRDLEGEESPCLVTIFFRKQGDKVDLTATFRSHNGTRAWPRNCFGLWRVMEEVCRLANEKAGRTEEHILCPGVLTVLSLSISLDPADLDQVQAYIDDYQNRSPRLTLDPYGYLRLAVDAPGEIVVQHYSHDDELLDEYRGPNPSALARILYQREVISDISHALYVGMQLERAWQSLLTGQPYVQDKSAKNQ